MKRKIKFIDKTVKGETKTTIKEINIRDYDMIECRQKNKSNIFVDKTKYNRKQKHKSSINNM